MLLKIELSIETCWGTLWEFDGNILGATRKWRKIIVPYLRYLQVRWCVWNFSRLGFHEMHFVTIFSLYVLWEKKLCSTMFHVGHGFVRCNTYTLLPKAWWNYQIKSWRVLWIYYCIDDKPCKFVKGFPTSPKAQQGAYTTNVWTNDAKVLEFIVIFIIWN